MVSSTYAKYAEALVEVAEENRSIEVVSADLKTFTELLMGNDELLAVFSMPSVSLTAKRRILEEIASRLRLARIVVNFLLLLLDRGRIDQLDAVFSAYQEVLDERSGVVRVGVVSSHPLGKTIRNQLKVKMNRLTGQSVKITYDVDETLIGGLKLQFGSMVFDGTIRTQLEELRRRVVFSSN